MSVSREQPPALLREFLLGTLSEVDRDRLEEDLLADGELYELLQATEEELIDECVNGALSKEDCESFFRYLALLPGGRDRIDFAQRLKALLARSTVETTPQRSSILRRVVSWLTIPERLAWSAAVLLAAAFGTWSSVAFRPERLAAERSPVVLNAGLMRGSGEMETVVLSRDELLLELRLDLGSRDYQEYRAALHDADSQELFAASRLEATEAEDQFYVAFSIPAARLENADYYVTLEGMSGSASLESVGRYSLRIKLR